ncbi:hypothetical protein SAMN05421854_108188 [Amycolatopsis rubida]|uniref:Uncharacterized protein n=1 Tax=Amycolatopsis rubida TaxID=112413 RepID=A0A1I5V2K5_9PSEU|nr:hypothetical protein SAMN05421854_108188 [Amycolatopsis rubida]
MSTVHPMSRVEFTRASRTGMGAAIRSTRDVPAHRRRTGPHPRPAHAPRGDGAHRPRPGCRSARADRPLPRPLHHRRVPRLDLAPLHRNHPRRPGDHFPPHPRPPAARSSTRLACAPGRRLRRVRGRREPRPAGRHLLPRQRIHDRDRQAMGHTPITTTLPTLTNHPGTTRWAHTHLNNTNPVMDPTGPEHAAALQAGAELPPLGTEFALQPETARSACEPVVRGTLRECFETRVVSR